MKNLLNAVGFQEHLYEDFADDTYELLRKLAESFLTMDGAALLQQSFNDASISASIITYLKVGLQLRSSLLQRLLQIWETVSLLTSFPSASHKCLDANPSSKL
jgi:hypothetical protein